MSGMRAVARSAASLVRRLGLDSNPLRRRMDRAESWLRIGLVAVFVVGAPLAAVSVGQWTSARMTHVAQSQAAAEYQVPATLVHDVSKTNTYAASAGMGWEVARWTAPDGSSHTGEVQAPLGAKTGSTVQIWTDQSGHLTDPPLSHSQIAGQTMTAIILTVLAFAVMVAVTLAILHRLLQRRRLSDWETAWSAVEPQWTRRLR